MAKRLETEFLEDAAVTGDKIAPGAIDSSKIDSVGEAKINFGGAGHAHTGAAGGAQIDHANLLNVTADQHHARQHALDSANWPLARMRA